MNPVRLNRKLTLLSICLFVAFAAPMRGRGADIPLSSGLRTIALSGQTVVGLLPGETMKGFANAVINDRGDVAFHSDFQGFPDSANGIVAGDRQGNFRLIMRFRGVTPEGPDNAVFETHSSPSLAGDGSVSFVADLSAPSIGPSRGGSIWTESPTHALTLAALDDTVPPGVDATTRFRLSSSTSARMNSQGDITFSAGLAGPNVNASNDSAMWVYRRESDTLQFIARTGEAFVATDHQVVIADVGTPVINDLGHIAFSHDAIFVETSPGRFKTLVKPGAPIVGTNAVITKIYGDLGFTNAGELSFEADAKLPNGELLPTKYWFTDSSGNIQRIVGNGDAVPGFSDTTFSGIQNDPRLGPNRYALFWASLRGPSFNSQNDQSIWIWHDGELRMVAQNGTHATGAPLATLFNGFDTFSETRISANGQIAFLALLRGAGVNSANDRGLWATTPTGDLILIAREGDRIEIAPGDFRTVASLQLPSRSSVEDGSQSPFSHRGDLAFSVVFTDGTSGIFATSAVAVPEPTALHLVGCALCIATLWVARKHVERSRRDTRAAPIHPLAPFPV